ncbi:MAG: winged helix-turn-helix domain-containing protein [Acidobacteria bacterium]|nr:winged helix-turn-helix domain-containing protein [Acidobacteriota bacterium]
MTERAPGDAVVCGPLWVSAGEMCEVRVRGRRVAMSVPRQRLLARLLRAQGRVVCREDLYRDLAGGPLPEGSRAVDVHVARIRRALGPLGRHVVAVRHVGYRIDVAALLRAR